VTEPEPNPAGVEAIYAEVRRLTGAVAGPTGSAAPVVTEVAPGIVGVAVRTPTLPPAAHTSCWVFGEGDLLAVDPGSPYPDQQDALVAEVAARGRLVAVLLTHHHGDHTGGAAALAARTGAPIWAHAATAAELPGLTIARTLEDGEELAVGGRRLRVLFTPGHATGHLCFRDAATGATAVGDMVAGLGTILIDPQGGHMATYLASLERMLEADLGALLPAHGPVIADGPAKLREYLVHRRKREALVLAALGSAPRDAAALCAEAYADTPPFLWPLAQRSLLAHLVKLVEDGAAVSDGTSWARA
jgi:glyoxylase-like metal-dependent hydrolase (beta-lactamase superfamily II)